MFSADVRPPLSVGEQLYWKAELQVLCLLPVRPVDTYGQCVSHIYSSYNEVSGGRLSHRRHTRRLVSFTYNV